MTQEQVRVIFFKYLLLIAIIITVTYIFRESVSAHIEQVIYQTWDIPVLEEEKPVRIVKFRDGIVICYVSEKIVYAGAGGRSIASGISCLVEPR